MIIATTGHRNAKLGGYNLPNPTYLYVCQQIDKYLREFKPEKVISGMALGSDQWFVNVAIKLGIPFIAAVPFLGQESRWPENSQKTYNKLLAKALDIVMVSPPGYTANKMQIRNQWMVNQCDMLLAIYSGTTGGTHNCIEYAKSINKKILIINPDAR